MTPKQVDLPIDLTVNRGRVSVKFWQGVVYIPGLNDTVMLMTAVPGKYAFVGTWILPIVLALSELGKYICRTWPKGFFAQIFVY